MKIILAIVGAAILIGVGVWAFQQYTTPVSTNSWGTMPDEYVILGAFSGTLPCADCPGLETTLTLVKYGEHIAEGTYTLTENYIDRSPEPTVTKGEWTTNRGTDKDIDATVYVLDPSGEQPRYFLKVDEDTIRMLDTIGNVIDATMPLELKRVGD